MGRTAMVQQLIVQRYELREFINSPVKIGGLEAIIGGLIEWPLNLNSEKPAMEGAQDIPVNSMDPAALAEGYLLSLGNARVRWR